MGNDTYKAEPIGDWIPAAKIYREAKRIRNETFNAYSYYRRILHSKNAQRLLKEQYPLVLKEGRPIVFRTIDKAIRQGVYLVQLPDCPDLDAMFISEQLVVYASYRIRHIRYLNDFSAFKLLAERGASVRYVKYSCPYRVADRVLEPFRKADAEYELAERIKNPDPAINAESGFPKA